MTDSELATKAQGVARCLSYNGNEHEAAASKFKNKGKQYYAFIDTISYIYN